jgi:hypothetical protein
MFNVQWFAPSPGDASLNLCRASPWQGSSSTRALLQKAAAPRQPQGPGGLHASLCGNRSMAAAWIPLPRVRVHPTLLPCLPSAGHHHMLLQMLLALLPSSEPGLLQPVHHHRHQLWPQQEAQQEPQMQRMMPLLPVHSCSCRVPPGHHPGHQFADPAALQQVARSHQQQPRTCPSPAGLASSQSLCHKAQDILSTATAPLPLRTACPQYCSTQRLSQSSCHHLPPA